jgi:enamine deaminase RidA (YjgF/YER057c/UK114 family)
MFDKTITKRLAELGYTYKPGTLERNFKGASFHGATRVGNLIYTSGHVSVLDGKEIRGKVGTDIDLETAQKGAEQAAYNCLCAAGAVVNIEKITRVVKLLGMVNVADGFDQTSEVINGCSFFIEKVFGKNSYHTRTAVGMVLPSNWAVEVEMIFAVE